MNGAKQRMLNSLPQAKGKMIDALPPATCLFKHFFDGVIRLAEDRGNAFCAYPAGFFYVLLGLWHKLLFGGAVHVVPCGTL